MLDGSVAPNPVWSKIELGEQEEMDGTKKDKRGFQTLKRPRLRSMPCFDSTVGGCIAAVQTDAAISSAVDVGRTPG